MTTPVTTVYSKEAESVNIYLFKCQLIVILVMIFEVAHINSNIVMTLNPNDRVFYVHYDYYQYFKTLFC